MNVAVLFGGNSEERDVSLASGTQVVRALREAGHEILAVDTAAGPLSPEQVDRFLSAGVPPQPPSRRALGRLGFNLELFASFPELRDVDVIFLALHGGVGEDGTLQAWLDLAGVAYTGSRHRASANAMDKDISKRLFRQAGIPTADWLVAPASAAQVERSLGYPVVVKPNKQGSTIGLGVVNDAAGLGPALREAFRFDDEVIIEHFVPGRELTVGILGNRALAVGEILPRHGGIFDYASKYQQGGAEEVFPARLQDSETRRIRALALKAHRTLKLEGYSRVDFRMDTGGGFWCLEANTLPGMTATSLLPQSARAAGISFPELCDRICRLALKRRRRRGGKHGGA